VSIQGTGLFRSSVPNNFCISVVHIFRIYEWQEDYDGNSTFPEKVLSVEVARDQEWVLSVVLQRVVFHTLNKICSGQHCRSCICCIFLP
jgi:hypothetical protein